MNDISIHERLTRVETLITGQTDTLNRMDGKLDKIDGRIREVEVKSAQYGSIAGGVVAVTVAFISSKLKGI